MKSYKEILLEVFNTSYNYKKVKETKKEVNYVFDSKNDKITVSFLKTRIEGSYDWTVDFYDKNGNTEANQKGDAFKIFATVIKVIKEFINNNEFERLRIRATKKDNGAENNKIKLYKKMLLKELPNSISLSLQKSKDMEIFILTNKLFDYNK